MSGRGFQIGRVRPDVPNPSIDGLTPAIVDGFVELRAAACRPSSAELPTEIARIADALERIADSLELLVGPDGILAVV